MKMRHTVALLAVAVVVAGAAGFAHWGRPRLGAGSLLRPGTGFTWAEDGVTRTRMLVRGRPAPVVDAVFTVRNEGRLPVTLTGLALDRFPGWLDAQRVTFRPGPPGVAPPAEATETLGLGPGEEAAIDWSLDLACRPVLMAGSYLQVETLPLRVRTLGVTRTVDLVLDHPITFAADPVADPGPTYACVR